MEKKAICIYNPKKFKMYNFKFLIFFSGKCQLLKDFLANK